MKAIIDLTTLNKQLSKKDCQVKIYGQDIYFIVLERKKEKEIYILSFYLDFNYNLNKLA